MTTLGLSKLSTAAALIGSSTLDTPSYLNFRAERSMSQSPSSVARGVTLRTGLLSAPHSHRFGSADNRADRAYRAVKRNSPQQRARLSNRMITCPAFLRVPDRSHRPRLKRQVH